LYLTLTHLIFTNVSSNAAIVPVVYFFFPETTMRSLEEMDRIFRKTSNVFDVVHVARSEPHMYGPNGELLRTLDDVEDDAVRRASVISNPNKNAARAHREHAEKDSDDNTATSEEK
jgi:hypothetical protein